MFSLFPCDKTRLTRPQMFLSLLLIWTSQKKRSKGALAREVMRRTEKRDGRSFFSPLSCYPSCCLRRSRFSREKEDNNSGKWIHRLTKVREPKQLAITSLRPHSKMVNSPFFLIHCISEQFLGILIKYKRSIRPQLVLQLPFFTVTRRQSLWVSPLGN